VSAAALEVAESMYQAARAATPAKMPESLFELGPAPQRRYLMLAEAAIAVTGPPTTAAAPAGDRELLDTLAEELAWKLLHPQQFADGVRSVLARYVETVGAGGISEEVRKAIEL
jgi:hypothetical protein